MFVDYSAVIAAIDEEAPVKFMHLDEDSQVYGKAGMIAGYDSIGFLVLFAHDNSIRHFVVDEFFSVEFEGEDGFIKGGQIDGYPAHNFIDGIL